MNRLYPLFDRARGAMLTTSMALVAMLAALPLRAQEAAAHTPGGEANLQIPDLSKVTFYGVHGHTLLLLGLVFCAAGMLFGLVTYSQLKGLPVHKSMREVSELIYETCKTYLIQQ